MREYSEIFCSQWHILLPSYNPSPRINSLLMLKLISRVTAIFVLNCSFFPPSFFDNSLGSVFFIIIIIVYHIMLVHFPQCNVSVLLLYISTFWFFLFELDMCLRHIPGLTFNSKTISGGLNSKAKSAVAKGSTLMKPTASQLAKQNRPPQIVGSRWLLEKLVLYHGFKKHELLGKIKQ